MGSSNRSGSLHFPLGLLRTVSRAAEKNLGSIQGLAFLQLRFSVRENLAARNLRPVCAKQETFNQVFRCLEKDPL